MLQPPEPQQEARVEGPLRHGGACAAGSGLAGAHHPDHGPAAAGAGDQEEVLFGRDARGGRVGFGSSEAEAAGKKQTPAYFRFFFPVGRIATSSIGGMTLMPTPKWHFSKDPRRS